MWDFWRPKYYVYPAIKMSTCQIVVVLGNGVFNQGIQDMLRGIFFTIYVIMVWNPRIAMFSSSHIYVMSTYEQLKVIEGRCSLETSCQKAISSSGQKGQYLRKCGF